MGGRYYIAPRGGLSSVVSVFEVVAVGAQGAEVTFAREQVGFLEVPGV